LNAADHEWARRNHFELFVSGAVAARRMALLDGIPVLDLAEGVHELANRLLLVGAVPAKARVDAVHIAVAAVCCLRTRWACRENA